MRKNRRKTVTGKFLYHEQGFGFVQYESGQSDIYISSDDVNGALDQDIVLCRVMSSKDDRRPFGEIVEIIESALTTVVGTLRYYNRDAFVMSDNKRFSRVVSIEPKNLNGARDGQKVLVEITHRELARPDRGIRGKVIEIIGFPNEPDVDIKSIMAAHGFSEVFSDAARLQAESTPQKADKRRFRGRLDLRGERIFTIDGADSKDLDDAVSICVKEDGVPGTVYRLGVHIADVAAYVHSGSALDSDAQNRGTSLYYADRVIPMLPERISNGICSLHPHVDRLAVSVLMDIDGDDGRVLSKEIHESVVNSRARLTYDGVCKALGGQMRDLAIDCKSAGAAAGAAAGAKDTGTGTDNCVCTNNADLPEEYAELLPDLTLMNKLRGVLRNRRLRRGAIDFLTRETKLVLDEQSRPVSVEARENTFSNGIIEEFMIVCNETVAEFVTNGNYRGEKKNGGGIGNPPFIFRTHDKPDPTKIKSFAESAAGMGFVLRCRSDEKLQKALQQLLEAAKDSPYASTLSLLMLRSMAKASYTHVNIGHFGLASDMYCHFTSPIRRYPDLFIHRVIKESLHRHRKVPSERQDRDSLRVLCEHCSVRERAADDTEREIVALKKVEYMSQFLGETFTGRVSGITSFGIFVELENTVEGLIRLPTLRDDYYVFDPDRLSVVGRRTGKSYTIGKKVDVTLVRVSTEERQIDFMFAQSL